MADSKSNTSRRRFIQGAAIGAATFSIVPRHVLGQGQTPPSDQLAGALIGCGGRGGGIADGRARGAFSRLGDNVRLVACCDVDRTRAQHVGRESNATYNETLNGVQTKHAKFHQF